MRLIELNLWNGRYAWMALMIGALMPSASRIVVAQTIQKTNEIWTLDDSVNPSTSTPGSLETSGVSTRVTPQWTALDSVEGARKSSTKSDKPRWRPAEHPLSIKPCDSPQSQFPSVQAFDQTPLTQSPPEVTPTNTPSSQLSQLSQWNDLPAPVEQPATLVAHQVEESPLVTEPVPAVPAEHGGTIDSSGHWNGDDYEMHWEPSGPPMVQEFCPQNGQLPSSPQSPFQFQEPADPSEVPSLPASLQLARTAQPQPRPRGSESIPEFVESTSAHGGLIEVIIGQGRLITLREDIAAPGRPEPIVAVGDPTVVDLEVAGPRHLRITGARIGVTDVSVITSDRQNLSLEVRVVADLSYVEAILRQSFPTSRVRMSQLREHVIVEGQARDSRQVAQIVKLIESYLDSVQAPSKVTGQSQASVNTPIPMGSIDSPQDQFDGDPGVIAPAIVDGMPMQAGVTPGINQPDLQVTVPAPRIINLLTVPGPQQVMLKVQVAELNRTALRTFGTTFLFQDGTTTIGSVVGPPLPGGGGSSGMTDLLLGLLNPVGSQGTLFAVLKAGEVNFFVDALRRNEVLKIMAEPTLVAMNGQEASFLAGGEFPVPVPQIAAAGVVSAGFQFKPFGVGLTFVPFIQDNDVIRLAVAPEVSALDFTTPATLLPETITPVPAFSTRKTRTVVELREGQTLAISGLLQTELSGTTARIPGLGDIPVVGQLFSGNKTRTQEKELVVLVTPYLVEGMDPEEVDALPGADVQDPTDCEFYLHGRIERRVCEPFRATSAWDDPFGLEHRRHLEASHVCGPYGYTP